MVRQTSLAFLTLLAAACTESTFASGTRSSEKSQPPPQTKVADQGEPQPTATEPVKVKPPKKHEEPKSQALGTSAPAAETEAVATNASTPSDPCDRFRPEQGVLNPTTGIRYRLLPTSLSLCAAQQACASWRNGGEVYVGNGDIPDDLVACQDFAGNLWAQRQSNEFAEECAGLQLFVPEIGPDEDPSARLAVICQARG